MSTQPFVTLYTYTIYHSTLKQLRRRLPTPFFANSPVAYGGIKIKIRRNNNLFDSSSIHNFCTQNKKKLFQSFCDISSTIPQIMKGFQRHLWTNNLIEKLRFQLIIEDDNIRRDRMIVFLKGV